MSSQKYKIAVAENEALVKQIEPMIKRLSDDPRSWWQTRKRYSKLNESLIKSYVVSKLRDVRAKGRAEADKFIEKLVSSKKNELPGEILEFISKNKSVWADFICKIASTQDIEALTGFFVPFIYGGISSRKNMTGELFGIVDFDENAAKTLQNERIAKAIRALTDFKQRGISVILIEGCANDVYSKQMLSAYRGSPNEAFFIIEREENGKRGELVSGQSAYDRFVLSELCAAKNVFVVLDPKESGSSDGSALQESWAAGKSRALSSYGILHGIWGDFGGGLGVSRTKGSCLALFDSKACLNSAIGGSFQMPTRGDEILSVVPRRVKDFLTSPALPMHLPNLYGLLLISQFVITAGKISDIQRIIV